MSGRYTFSNQTVPGRYNLGSQNVYHPVQLIFLFHRLSSMHLRNAQSNHSMLSARFYWRPADDVKDFVSKCE